MKKRWIVINYVAIIRRIAVNSNTKMNTTVRIPVKTIEYYKNNYKNIHAGASLAVEGYTYLRDEALATLKGVFTAKEVDILKESSNGADIQPSSMASRRHWEAEIADHFDMNGDFDVKQILIKIRSLSSIERFVFRESLILND